MPDQCIKRGSGAGYPCGFYKGSTDENGNEVRPYSYAKSVTEMDYEHGNGMAYNPYTRELVIAGGRNLSPENKGCLLSLMRTR